MTKAYSSFKLNCRKTDKLLESGLTGIAEKRKSFEKTVNELAEIKVPPGPSPRGYKLKAKRFTGSDGKEYVSMDPRGFGWLKKEMAGALAEHNQLKYYLYSILAVSIWGSFETYLVMLFEELFNKNNDMLKSNEKLTYDDAVANKDQLIQFLIEKKLDAIGHFTLTEAIEYLHNKINYRFSGKKRQDVEVFYLIRNIIAHSSGIVRNDLKDKLPSDIPISDSELRITKVYLERMLKTIKNNVSSIERHVENKFFK